MYAPFNVTHYTMKKFNLTKIGLGLALTAQLFCQTAMAIMPYEGVYNAPMDKTFNDFSFKVYKPIYKISDKKQQDNVFQIADYFSKNYPFSKTQIDQFFNDNFIITKSQKDEYLNSYIFKPNKTDLNIQDIDFRENSNGKILIINFTQPICFKRDNFDKNMINQDFNLELSPPTVYFTGKMKNPSSGKVNFGLADTDDRSLRCVDTLIFDTFEA